jgi:hypothetical protein
MHPLDSLAEVRLGHHRQHMAADLRAAAQRRAAASFAARLRAAVRPHRQPAVPPPCGGTARHAGPA